MVEKAALLISAFGFLLSVGLTTWVYKIMETRIQFLKEDIEKLKSSEGRWIVKYQKVAKLILKHRECSPGTPCQIHEEYVKLIDEEGIL